MNLHAPLTGGPPPGNHSSTPRRPASAFAGRPRAGPPGGLAQQELQQQLPRDTADSGEREQQVVDGNSLRIAGPPPELTAPGGEVIRGGGSSSSGRRPASAGVGRPPGQGVRAQQPPLTTQGEQLGDSLRVAETPPTGLTGSRSEIRSSSSSSCLRRPASAGVAGRLRPPGTRAPDHDLPHAPTTEGKQLVDSSSRIAEALQPTAPGGSRGEIRRPSSSSGRRRPASASVVGRREVLRSDQCGWEAPSREGPPGGGFAQQEDPPLTTEGGEQTVVESTPRLEAMPDASQHPHGGRRAIGGSGGSSSGRRPASARGPGLSRPGPAGGIDDRAQHKLTEEPQRQLTTTTDAEQQAVDASLRLGAMRADQHLHGFRIAEGLKPTTVRGSSRGEISGRGSGSSSSVRRPATAREPGRRRRSRPGAGRAQHQEELHQPQVELVVDSLNIGRALWGQVFPGYYPQRTQNSTYRTEFIDRGIFEPRSSRHPTLGANRQKDEQSKYTEYLVRNKVIMRTGVPEVKIWMQYADPEKGWPTPYPTKSAAAARYLKYQKAKTKAEYFGLGGTAAEYRCEKAKGALRELASEEGPNGGLRWASNRTARESNEGG